MQSQPVRNDQLYLNAVRERIPLSVMKKIFCYSGIFLTVICLPQIPTAQAHRACAERYCFDPVAQVGTMKLPLRGIGTKRFFGMALFDAALYADTQASPAQLLAGLPKKLVLRYHRRIKKDQITQAAEHCLRENPRVDYASIKQRVDTIGSFYRTVRDRDEYALVYLPGTGTELYFNGKLEGTIPGEDFAEAYFGIWLSEKSLNKKLTRKLLNT